MNKKYLEWFRQADYDIETAEFMFIRMIWQLCKEIIQKQLQILFLRIRGKRWNG